MKKEDNEKPSQYIIPADILFIFKFAQEIRWLEIRQSSIFRILYLASVLFSFINPKKNNPFQTYKFSVDSSGPYDAEITKALDFLIKDEYIKRTSGDDILEIATNPIENLSKIEFNKERSDWLNQVIFILGLYGENKIYDFIFRDPQYQLTIKSNTKQGLNINPDNETIKILKEFQGAFEETLPVNVNLTSQRYLELYFEYIFGKILKRED